MAEKSVLDEVPEGGTVNLQTFAVTKTDASGRFEIKLPKALDSRYVGDDGSVDLRILASDRKNSVMWQYTATRPKKTTATKSDKAIWSTAKSDAAKQSQPADLRFDLSPTSPQAFDAHDDPAGWVTDNSAKLTKDAAASARSTVLLPHSAANLGASNTAAPCGQAKGTLYTQNPERFAVVSTWSGAKGTVYQSQSVSHTLGLGIQVDGPSGAWKPNGTASINLTKGAGAQLPGVVDATVGNEVNYRLWIGTGDCAKISEIRPESTYAFLSIAERHGHVAYTHCSTAFHGATYWKDSGKNLTYGAGVALGWMNVSAQSGWNGNTKIEWVVTQDSKLCGSASTGWASSPDMSADKL
ncbi:hypothetical protein [Actinoallomurus sp. NPDC050550]|uniref:hypothetical protein n=1 Tax=Actinoallomurus sp. NPDC050550 TaxID=3154937 RepID=UPI0033ED665B